MKQLLLSLLPRREDWTPKTLALTAIGAAWFVFSISDYGVLVSQREDYYSAEFTPDNRTFEGVRCRYWIGAGGRDIYLRGPLRSFRLREIRCPFVLKIQNKWDATRTINDNRSAGIVRIIDDARGE
ncbi:MAG: hypothetical protein ACRCY3_11265 [Sphingorhabdus sp.]